MKIIILMNGKCYRNSKMKFRKTIYFAFWALCGLAANAIAAVPAEVPSWRSTQIFSPYYFYFQDSGTGFLGYGGAQKIHYYVFEYRQETWPTSVKPEVGFEQFYEFITSPAGILHAVGHGWSDNIDVEAYDDSVAGQLAAEKAVETYKTKYGLSDSEIKSGCFSDDDPTEGKDRGRFLIS